ncbi:hypothetical protein J3R08_001887 [Micromonospora sp. HB375]|nr:hypothetical protein [Micromonospora sp. HB375]
MKRSKHLVVLSGVALSPRRYPTCEVAIVVHRQQHIASSTGCSIGRVPAALRMPTEPGVSHVAVE